MRSSFLLTFACAVLLSACEMNPSGPRSFVSTLGADTLTVESFTKTDQNITGVLVERTPYTRITHYSANISESGNIVRLEAEQSTPVENPNGSGMLAWVAEIGEGKAIVMRTAGENPGTTEMDVSGVAIPTLGRSNSAMFVFEQVANHVSDTNFSSSIQLVGPTSARPSTNNAQVVSADTVSMDFFGSPRVGWIGKDGQVLGTSGAATTLKVETRSVPSIDAAGLAARWAAMDARGEGIGTPSIAGTVSASIGGATMEVVYSRPAKRGRDIWGGLVPYGTVWRTGANAATQFTTDRALMISGSHVPAGAYTLWTLFTESGQHLIVNSQTGQWGTQYDESQDLVRIPLTESGLGMPVERFTISIEDSDMGGTLNLDWDATRYSVDFMVH